MKVYILIHKQEDGPDEILECYSQKESAEARKQLLLNHTKDYKTVCKLYGENFKNRLSKWFDGITEAIESSLLNGAISVILTIDNGNLGRYGCFYWQDRIKEEVEKMSVYFPIDPAPTLSAFEWPFDHVEYDDNGCSWLEIEEFEVKE